MIDHGKCIEAVARHLLGEPNRPLSSAHQWRYGTHGSLCVEIGGEKRGTWYDHERCVGGGVLDLVTDKLGLPNSEAMAWLKSELSVNFDQRQKPGDRRHIVATYDYRDETGTLLFQVVRFDPKDFRQRRPDGKGGWVWTKGVRQVPYRLEALLERSEGCPVFIVEGEKDVDRLAALGFIATCNAGGAGKWTPELNEHFRGAFVYILADNDESGRLHAQQVAKALYGVVENIRIVGLPDLGPKQDVSNWLDAGGNADHLVELCEAARIWAPAEAVDSDDGLLGEWDAGDDDATIEPRGWLLGNTFCRRFLSSLIAGGGTGKTAVRIVQALAMASGRNLTDEHVFRRSRVLFLNLEDDRDELRRRVRAAMLRYNINCEDVKGWLFLAALSGKDWKLAVGENGAVQRGELAARIERIVINRKIDAVIIDPFVKSHGVPENDNCAIDQVAAILAQIAIVHDCAVDAPHHTNKLPSDPGNVLAARGASAFKDAGRLVYTLLPMTADEAELFGVSQEERRRLIRMDSGKLNVAPPATAAKWFRLASVSLDNGTDAYPSGDSVQVAEPWQPPDMWQDLSPPLCNRILDEIDAGMENGERYSAAAAAKERAAWRIVLKHVPTMTERQARDVGEDRRLGGARLQIRVEKAGLPRLVREPCEAARKLHEWLIFIRVPFVQSTRARSMNFP